jgi:hypothetical protein
MGIVVAHLLASVYSDQASSLGRKFAVRHYIRASHLRWMQRPEKTAEIIRGANVLRPTVRKVGRLAVSSGMSDFARLIAGKGDFGTQSSDVCIA